MASRKKPGDKMPKTKDQHRSRKMFRVPDEYHQLFKELSRENNRPMSWELKLALRNHLKASGKIPPDVD